MRLILLTSLALVVGMMISCESGSSGQVQQSNLSGPVIESPRLLGQNSDDLEALKLQVSRLEARIVELEDDVDDLELDVHDHKRGYWDLN